MRMPELTPPPVRSPLRSPRPSRRLRALALALGLAGLAPAACTKESPDLDPQQPPPAEPGGTEEENQNLIGGFAANDARLDNIGAMVLIPPFGGPNEHLCGASVIGAETLVTAKHCADIIPLAMSFGYKLGYSIGADITRPKRVIELAAFELAPGDEGGFVGMGRDVAVLHLEHPLPPEFQPLEIGALSDEDIGKPFAAIGYGIQDNSGKHGTRRLGKQTLKGREGRTLEHLFGSFERFLEWLTTGNVAAKNLVAGYPGRDGEGDSDAGAPADGGSRDGGTRPDGGGGDGGNPLEEIARFYWDFFVLEKDYEVVTGGFPGDAQPCFGDSGSPLVKYKDGKYFSYGVVSGGVGSRDLICDLGTVYATFGPEVAAFLDTAKKWVDPCGDMDSQGTCDGNVAKRCTNLVEGRRRVVDFDCGLVGMTCNKNSGQVSCDDNVFGPPPPTRPTPPSTPPEIRDMVNRVFKAGR